MEQPLESKLFRDLTSKLGDIFTDSKIGYNLADVSRVRAKILGQIKEENKLDEILAYPAEKYNEAIDKYIDTKLKDLKYVKN